MEEYAKVNLTVDLLAKIEMYLRLKERLDGFDPLNRERIFEAAMEVGTTLEEFVLAAVTS